MIQIIWMGVRSVLTLPHILPQNSSPLFLHLSSVRRGVGLLRVPVLLLVRARALGLARLVVVL